tara:strand:+ start:2608 stop:5307 length:2700 start_codon:yes stop_codon:yes gene_type:complete
MNSTHIKEANIENDLYYTGIAEKAYDKVVRFLTKHKDKLEGEGENSIVNKPFIPLTQWKGVALRGTDIDKNFPSLSEVVLFFIPTKSTSRGGVTIAGGFTNKSLKVGGISFKGVIVNANLIGDYNGKYMDTRLDKDTFIHEYIHFLDHLRYRSRGLSKTSAKYLDTQDIEGYYNTPEEFNAYYQEGQNQIVRMWKNLPDDFKKKRLESYKAFQSWVIDVQFFDRDFLTYIDKKYLKKFKKRLANLYMYIQKGNLSEIISEDTIKVDTNSIKKWSKDLRVLTKAYKQIGDNSEDPQTIKDFKKVRRAFGTFQQNFEDWVYKFFLQYKWIGSKERVETWEEKEVREKCWRAVTSLGGNFPEMWDFQTKKHRVSPQILAREREKNIRRYRAAFREGINALLQYIAINGDQEREKPIEQAQIGPVKLVIHNFKRKGGSEQGEASRERSFKQLVDGIKSWSKKIQKAGFGKCIEGLTVDIDFGLTGEGGDMVSGEYYMNKDMLKLYGAGMTQDTFTHELGHRFWYRELPSNAKKHWQDTIKSKKVAIDFEDVDEYVKKYFNKHGERLYKRKAGLKVIDKKETNAETKAKFKALQMTPVYSTYNREEVATKLSDRWVGPGKEIPIEHITSYGNTNAEEAFAEAFKLYIVRGPGKLGEWTRWFFREIVRTGGANINEMKIQEINMKSSPKSGAQVSKMLKDKGFPNVKVQKSGSYYHFIGGVANHFKEQTIHDYGLRIGDFTFEQWFKEFKAMYLGNDIPAESFSNNKIISKNNSDTKHPDMKYIKEALNEVAMNKDNVHEFIKFAKNALQLKEKVSVKLLEKRHENMTAACYDPNTNEISIYTKGRAYADICRSIAHELVHQKQNELGVLEVDSGQTGSDIENEANACAGIIMRNFGEIVGNLYD